MKRNLILSRMSIFTCSRLLWIWKYIISPAKTAFTSSKDLVCKTFLSYNQSWRANGFTTFGQFHFMSLILDSQAKGTWTTMSFSKYSSYASLRQKIELLGSSAVQFIIIPGLLWGAKEWEQNWIGLVTDFKRWWCCWFSELTFST